MDFSTVILTGLSKQDEKLVKANPGFSIEQLAAAGLTEKGSLTLEAFVASIKPYVPKHGVKAKGTLQPSNIRRTNGMRDIKKGARVHNTITGQTQFLKPKVAEKVLGKLNYNRQMSMHGRAYEAK